ncbi:MAG TPA: MlaD family protein [candidate division Zixibacteria bacterium]|nr:MCE family protein [candidate division Zixibacteria bacterium]MDD4918263.1 MlaD family protein [candidate division Zixibacteria bacterium]MDM7973162.1 MlaD family protein [candidate division Zixibacteria bacterium]HOD65842.1 MlaD family protein [candidate division Zixibacteria bacterium]HOZ07819.1 MlaD family protein [candidate division Zixibacteria bacterium]
MAAKNIEFRVGVIILIGLVVLGASLYWLQGYKLERNAQVIQVLFDDVGTLSVGDRVTVSGVHRGKVDRLDLVDDGVLVKILLYRDVVLHRDARFIIRNMGVMGERFIAITPGKEGAPFDFDSVAVGEYDTGLPEVMGELGEMVIEVRNLVGSFRRNLGSDSTLEALNQTVRNLEDVSGSMAEFLDANQSGLNSAIRNFQSAAGRLNELVTRNADQVDSTLATVNRTSARLEEFTYRLDTLAGAARQFADMLNNPDGTAQLLLQDRRLYDDLRSTADNIDDLVKDIRANPRKYLDLKVEIF